MGYKRATAKEIIKQNGACKGISCKNIINQPMCVLKKFCETPARSKCERIVKAHDWLANHPKKGEELKIGTDRNTDKLDSYVQEKPQRNNKALLESLNKAVTERLDDPKNVEKGEFPKLMGIVIDGIDEEYTEVISECSKAIETGKLISKRLREELADLATFCAFGIVLCDKEKGTK